MILLLVEGIDESYGNNIISITERKLSTLNTRYAFLRK